MIKNSYVAFAPNIDHQHGTISVWTVGPVQGRSANRIRKKAEHDQILTSSGRISRISITFRRKPQGTESKEWTLLSILDPQGVLVEVRCRISSGCSILRGL
jgi:hypothetical protein